MAAAAEGSRDRVTDVLHAPAEPAAVWAAQRSLPPRSALPPGGPGPRSVCLYTPSADPSGMGAHMVDLAAELAGSLPVSLMGRQGRQGRQGRTPRRCARTP